MNKKFVCMSLGGIANRVKTLVSCMYLSEIYDGEVLLYWPKTMTCFCSFSKLFKKIPKVREIGKDELIKIIKSKKYRYHEDTDYIYKNSHKEYEIFTGWRMILLEEDIRKYDIKNDIDLKFDSIPPQIRDIYVKYFKRIIPCDEIKAKTEQFSALHNQSKSIGIHIRRGDFMPGKGGIADISPTKLFIKRINELFKSNNYDTIFLCTDSKEVEDELLKNFGKRVIKYEKNNFDKLNEGFVQDGLIDMLILSKTSHVLRTYLSTFTEGSWWFSLGKQGGETIIDEEFLKAHVKEKNKKDHYVNIKKFLYNLITPLEKKLLSKVKD